MTTEKTLYKFQDGYILLEDLESWFSKGFVTPEDSIRIFQKSGVSVKYKISALIKLYGSRHPFRRILEVKSSDDSEDVLGPSESLRKVCGAFGSKKVDTNLRIEKCQFLYLDFPLFNVDNEKGDERITGKDVIDEMEKLKKLFNIEHWTQKYTEYFFFLFRRRHGDKEKMTVCRLCNYTPLDAKQFFLHFFDDSHILQLSEHQVSIESFNFWIRHFDQCAKSKTSYLSEESFSTSFERIPLFHSNKTSNNKSRRKMITAEEIQCLQKLFVRIDHESLNKEDHFLARFFKLVPSENFCDACNCNMPKQRTRYQYIQHILSETHLKSLTGVSSEDINFWRNCLNIELNRNDTENKQISRILMKRNSTTIPLIDFKLECTIIEENLRLPKIEKLRAAHKLVDDKFLTGIDVSRDSVCYACSTDSKNVSIGNQKELVEHIFSEQHVRYLLHFGFSENDFSFWLDKFTDSEKKAEELQTWHEKSSVLPVIVKPVAATPKSVIQKIPEVKKTPETPTAVVKPRTVSVNNPRIPLLDCLPAATRCNQRVFVASFRQITESLSWSAKNAAKNKIVNWKCEYCGLIQLSTELDAFNHIISQKHKEKMKFTAPADDFKFWFDWVRKMNEESTPQPVPPIQSVQTPAKVKKVTEAPKTSATLVSKVPTNSPRVPMLDWMPANEKIVSKEKFNEVLDHCAEVFRKDRKRIEAGKMSVLYSDCSICSTRTKKIRPSNMQDALLHIIKDEHRKKMQYQSCLSDLLYWKNWVETFGVPPKPVEQKPPAALRAPVDRATVQYSRKPITKEEKREPFYRSANHPRVPLLDVPQNRELLMPQREFESRYHAIRMKLENRKSCPETDQKIICFCFHCHGVRQMTSVYEVMQHVFDGIHDKRIRFNANRSDFDYYDNLVKKMPIRSTTQLPNTKELVATLKKSPAVSVVIPVQKVEKVPSDSPAHSPVKPENAQKTGNGKVKNEVFKRPANSPRIPLLDVPQSQGGLMSQIMFKERYNAVCVQLNLRSTCPETNQKMTCVCYHCPGTVRLTSVLEVLRHVFDGEHAKNICFSANRTDFDYYDNLVKRMPLRPINPPISKEPVPAPVTNSPVPPIKKTNLQLPLFVEPDLNYPEDMCFGPTNMQIDFVRRWSAQHYAVKHSYVENNVYCGHCNLDMSMWTLLRVARHAFSVPHILVILKTRGFCYEYEFDWWISHLTNVHYLIPPSLCTLPVVGHLGGLLLPLKTDFYSEAFFNFNTEELELIANIDEAKIMTDDYLLKVWGGCAYCEMWFLTGMESFRHFVSHAHFAKIRQRHPVNKIIMVPFMNHVKKCQKTESRCSIM